jgi:hypothetical protein
MMLFLQVVWEKHLDHVLPARIRTCLALAWITHLWLPGLLVLHPSRRLIPPLIPQTQLLPLVHPRITSETGLSRRHSALPARDQPLTPQLSSIMVSWPGRKRTAHWPSSLQKHFAELQRSFPKQPVISYKV